MAYKKRPKSKYTVSWWSDTLRMIDDGHDYFWNKRGGKPNIGSEPPRYGKHGKKSDEDGETKCK
jgi:hypothetical protein